MIYLLEDEASIRNLVIYALKNAGLPAEGFDTAGAFRRAVRRAVPSLALLDLTLPDGDGLDVLRWLRQSPATARLPVMILSARSTEYDKVQGLDLGADDYLPKPFGMMELVARVKRLQSRTQAQTEPDTLCINGLCIAFDRYEVSVNGANVPLTHKEFEVLALLARAGGRVFTREQIMSAVWGYDFDGESRTVDVHIRTLRQKLGSCGALIETVRGVGYKMQDARGKRQDGGDGDS